MNRLIGLDDNLLGKLQRCRRLGYATQTLDNEVERHATGHFAGAMPTHAVRDHGKPDLTIDSGRILVVRTHPAGFGQTGKLKAMKFVIQDW
jgi:hypothetical protein